MKNLSLDRHKLVSYLNRKGWLSSAESDENFTVFRYGDTQDNSGLIAIPKSGDQSMPRPYVNAALENLEVIEGRSASRIIEDILGQEATDILNFISHQYGLPSGKISLNALRTLVKDAYRTMVAAAQAAYRPRAVHSGQQPKCVREYCAAVQVGIPQPGSYVIPLLSPAEKDFTIKTESEPRQWPLLPELAETKFSRRVALKLHQALASLREAEHTDNPLILDVNVGIAQGISAELCSALASSLDASGKVSISFQWSQNVKAGLLPNVLQTSSFCFNQSSSEFLRRVAVHYRASIQHPHYELVGQVTGIRQSSQYAVIEVFGKLPSGRSRRVDVHLSPLDGCRAALALAKQRFISVLGTLQVDPAKPKPVLLEGVGLTVLEVSPQDPIKIPDWEEEYPSLFDEDDLGS